MQLQLLAGVHRRKKELIQVLCALVVLLVTTVVLVQAGSVGWRNGVLFAVADATATVLPGNIDTPVALAAGTVVGLLILFAADTTKRVQTVVLTPVAGVVIFQLWQRNHVVDAVSRELPYFVVSTLLTITAVVFLTNRIHIGPEFRPRSVVQELLLMHFPAASKVLFGIFTIVVVVVTTQYPFVTKSAGDPAFPVVLLSSLVAIPSLAVFVQYTSRTDVVTVTPHGSVGNDVKVCVLTGLWTVARQYHGRPADRHSERLLQNAVKLGGEQPDFTGSVRFRYLPTRLLRRIVEIASTDYQLTQVASAYGQETATKQSERFRVITAPIKTVKLAVLQLLPTVSHSRVSVADGALKTIELADTVLLSVPFPEESEGASVHTDIERAAGLLREIKSADEIAEDIDVRLIITHANRAEGDGTEYNFGLKTDREQILDKLSERVSGEEQSLSDDIRCPEGTNANNNIGYISAMYPDSIYPVAGTSPFDTDSVRGFERILQEIGS